MGPVTVGYTQSETSGRGYVAGADMTATTAYGVVFAVNENLSVSYNNHETDFKHDAAVDTTQEATGIAIAYTMGGATLAIQNNSMDNVTGTAGTNDEITEVSLSLAF